MASDEQRAYSTDFIEATTIEADRLRGKAAELREDAAKYSRRAEVLTTDALSFEQQAQELDEILGRAPQLRLGVPDTGLSGQRLRDAAIEVLARFHGLGHPIHYRDWYSLLTDAGSTVAGQDPLATFLTQISRSPVVQRSESGPGVYLLDPNAAGQAAMRDLTEARGAQERAQAELSAARDSHAPKHATAELEARATEASRWVRSAERRLTEVARVQTRLQAATAI